MKVRISRAARSELAELVNWLVDRSPAAAEQAADRVLLALRQLSEFPESGSPVEGGVRQLVIRFGRDGFVARYRILKQGVLIEAIWHGRHDR